MRFHSLPPADPGDLSRRFAALLADGDPGPGGMLVGAEHEYQVVRAGDTTATVDFRTIVHDLGLGRGRLDPDDPYGYRLPSGNAVTCDEAEAEIVLAPLNAVAGSATRLAATARAEREGLERRLGPELALRGHSTHLSVSVPTAIVEPVGRLFAQAFGADVMRLVDSADRCGIWVRPRADRLEVCVDFIDGTRLVAVATFVAAATAACVRAVRGLDAPLPPLLRVAARRPRERSGWHLARRAFRGDPFAEDGTAPLHLLTGGTMSAAEHLAEAWRLVRTLAGRSADPVELASVDALVGGSLLEGSAQAAARPPAHGSDRQAIGDASLATVFGAALEARARDGYQVAPVAMTWGFGIFLLLRDRRPFRAARRAFVSVPRASLSAFLGLLDGGGLDPVLREYLASRPSGRRLERPEDVREAGLFDELGARRALLPAEPPLGVLRLDALRHHALGAVR